MNTTNKVLIGGGVAAAALGLLFFSNRANASQSTLTQGDIRDITVETNQPNGNDPYGKLSGPVPRGIRNNNPLNLVATNIKWNGKTGNDGTFEVFDTPFNGIRAAARNLKTYRDAYGLRTIRGIITRWTAGDSYQSQSNYIGFVAHKMGISADNQLATADEYTQLVISMIMFENGNVQPYDYDLIKQAVQNGLA